MENATNNLMAIVKNSNEVLGKKNVSTTLNLRIKW